MFSLIDDDSCGSLSGSLLCSFSCLVEPGFSSVVELGEAWPDFKQPWEMVM